MMRHVTEEGIRLIKHFESLSLKPYLCPAKIWTIGYGHTGADITQSTPPITLAQANALLQHDLLYFEKAVLRLINRPLTDGQFNALVSFTFNLGAGVLQRSTLRMRCNRGEDAAVPAEFMRWVWGGGKKLPGLVKRRRVEVGLCTSSPYRV